MLAKIIKQCTQMVLQVINKMMKGKTDKDSEYSSSLQLTTQSSGVYV